MSEAKTKRLYLGMPGYGSLSAGAARGFYKATREPDAVLHYQEGSLLANNFNALWCGALNCDPAPDYFAMQHADVEPEDYWLDSLIEEMEAHDLDVLGVAVPIKDHHGLTSIALHANDGDDWKALCRLTMTEIFQLPETFTSEDTGHPVLLNTGLWVCRFNPEWATQVHFTINDRLVRDNKTGKYLAQVEPEDWWFSRNLHALGLKIGCTRKIKLMHRGGQVYPNTQPWGDAFDSQFVSKSQINSQAGAHAPIAMEV